MKITDRVKLLRTPACLAGPDGAILSANAGALEVLGIRDSSFIAHNMRDLPMPEPQSAVNKQLDSDATNTTSPMGYSLGNAVRGWIRQKIDDGESAGTLCFCILDHSNQAPQNSNGHVDCEERISARLHNLSMLTTVVGHELNNLMTAILGSVELSQKGPVSCEIDRCDLARISTAAQRAVELNCQIVKLSRAMRLGGEDALPLKGDVVMKAAIKVLRERIPKNVILQYDLAEGCPELSFGFENVSRVLLSASATAIASLGANGGKIHVTMGTVTQNGDPETGLRDRNVSKDFEIVIGVQSDVYTQQDMKTPSWGLESCASIVNALGGQLIVKKVSDCLKSITVQLPLDPIPELEQNPPNHGTRGLAHRILCIASNETHAQVLRSGMMLLGCHVTAYCDMISAIDHLCTAPDDFDILVCEEELPGFIPETLVNTVRLIRSDVPVLVVTQPNSASRGKCPPYAQASAPWPLDLLEFGKLVRRTIKAGCVVHHLDCIENGLIKDPNSRRS
jgi:hypothetical protein